MRTQREHHVHLGANALNQAADLGKIRWHVEYAIRWTNNVNSRLITFCQLFWHDILFWTKFGPEPSQRPVFGLPLVLVNGAW